MTVRPATKRRHIDIVRSGMEDYFESTRSEMTYQNYLKRFAMIGAKRLSGLTMDMVFGGELILYYRDCEFVSHIKFGDNRI